MDVFTTPIYFACKNSIRKAPGPERLRRQIF